MVSHLNTITAENNSWLSLLSLEYSYIVHTALMHFIIFTKHITVKVELWWIYLIQQLLCSFEASQKWRPSCTTSSQTVLNLFHTRQRENFHLLRGKTMQKKCLLNSFSRKKEMDVGRLAQLNSSRYIYFHNLSIMITFPVKQICCN